MSSAWKNAVPRREHRERPQPAARKHLGLLEKHKDYVKRARSHHRKRDRMTALKRRAELRNQDEFYYGMSGAKTKDGVHMRERPSGQPSAAVIKLLKSQDIGYVTVKGQAERRKVEKLRAALRHAEGTASGRHLLFREADEAGAQLAAGRPGAAWEGDSEDEGGDSDGMRDGGARGSPAGGGDGSSSDGEGAAGRREGRAGKRGRDAMEAEEAPALSADEAADALADAMAAASSVRAAEARADSAAKLGSETGAAPAAQLLAAAASEGPRAMSSRAKARRARSAAKRSKLAYEELREREKRAAVLGSAAAHFAYQKHIMGKGRRVKVAPATGSRPAQFKWKRERKR